MRGRLSAKAQNTTLMKQGVKREDRNYRNVEVIWLQMRCDTSGSKADASCTNAVGVAALFRTAGGSEKILA